MSWFIVYLWSISDKVSIILTTSSCIFGVICITCWNKSLSTDYLTSEGLQTYKNVVKKLLPITIILLSILSVIPPKDDIPIIYALPKVANSEFVEDLPKDAKEIYDLGIEKIKSELKPKQVKLKTNKEGEK